MRRVDAEDAGRKRRATVVAAVLVLGSATVALVAYAWARSRVQDTLVDDTNPFTLCTSHVALPRLRVAHARWSPPLVAALALSLSPADRSRLEAALEMANTRLEARANPMLEDLGDGDADATVTAWFADGTTATTTLLSFALDRFCASDGLCVRVVPRGQPCPEGSRPPSDEREAGRARFLAWPYGHAIVAQHPTAGEAHALAYELRQHGTASKRVGVVLTSADEEEAKGAELMKLRDLWIRHQTLRVLVSRRAREGRDAGSVAVPDDDAPDSDDADAGNAGPRAYPASLGAGDVLVVPRLSAISEDGAFRDEVSGHLTGRGVIRR